MDPSGLGVVNSSLITREYAKGDTICRVDSPAEYWYGVKDGLVKMSSVTPAGRDLSFIGIAAGGWFGEGTLLKGERRRYDIIALRDSSIIQMPRTLFLHLVDSSPPFSHWLLMQLNERLSQFIALLANDRASSSTARIARTLAWMFNPYLYPGMSSDIPITQEEIAHLGSLSRSRTNEALGRLESAGLIKIGYGHVSVLQVEGLRSFAD